MCARWQLDHRMHQVVCAHACMLGCLCTCAHLYRMPLHARPTARRSLYPPTASAGPRHGRTNGGLRCVLSKSYCGW
jgi:hypothetical protein